MLFFRPQASCRLHGALQKAAWEPFRSAFPMFMCVGGPEMLLGLPLTRLLPFNINPIRPYGPTAHVLWQRSQLERVCAGKAVSFGQSAIWLFLQIGCPFLSVLRTRAILLGNLPSCAALLRAPSRESRVRADFLRPPCVGPSTSSKGI